MTGFLHHIDLSVSDVAAARPVYDIFLRHAGFTPKGHGADWAGWDLGDNRYPCVTLNQAKGRNAARKHDRHAPGLHHLALRAKSRADVDALHAKLVKAGVNVLDAPAAYPEYGRGYYAVFFADPDGIKLEYAYTPPKAELRV
jgi:catechol 2,3-dioxygenase-like lactoylglutathione lyase family enzyme